MTEIEEMPSPTPITLVSDNCMWAVLYWCKGIDWPMVMYAQDKADVIKWARQASGRDCDKPLKLYRLDY